jgi:hypothetical protein
MRKLLCILNLVLSCEVSTAWAQFAPVNEQRLLRPETGRAEFVSGRRDRQN